MPNPLQLPLEKLEAAILRLKPVLIDALGVEALHFIDDNFRLQGFQGTTFQPWPKRKKKDKGAARKILVKDGVLRRSPKQHNGAESVTISTDVPYAQVHNEGGEINMPARGAMINFRRTSAKKGGRLLFGNAKTHKIVAQAKVNIGAHKIKMPKRQFIGESPVLSRRCEKAVLRILIANLD